MINFTEFKITPKGIFLDGIKVEIKAYSVKRSVGEFAEVTITFDTDKVIIFDKKED